MEHVTKAESQCLFLQFPFRLPFTLRLQLVPQNEVVRAKCPGSTKKPIDCRHVIKHCTLLASCYVSRNDKSQANSQYAVVSNGSCHGSGVISAPVHDKAFRKCNML